MTTKHKVNVMTGPDDVPQIFDEIFRTERAQIVERLLALGETCSEWSPPPLPDAKDYTPKQQAEIMEAIKQALAMAFTIAATAVLTKPMPEFRVQHIPIGAPAAEGAKGTVH